MIMKKIRWLLLAITATFALPSNAVVVDLELALVIDVSNSVSSTEYFQQINGYRDAFLSASIQNQISSLTNGIAVGVFFFNGSASEPLIPTWYHLTNAASSTNLANLIAAIPEPGGPGSGGVGSTDIAEGVNLAISSMTGANGFEGSRLIIDVSGDGQQNVGCNVNSNCIDTIQAARDAAAALNIIVNGLAIDVSGSTTIYDYYTANVITAGGFVQAATFENFSNAVSSKIGREICDPRQQDCSTVPEPGSLALFGLGLVGVFLRRRKLV